jgi:hypothetical protein
VLAAAARPGEAPWTPSSERNEPLLTLEDMDNRLARLEESVVSLLELLKQILSLSGASKKLEKDKI